MNAEFGPIEEAPSCLLPPYDHYENASVDDKRAALRDTLAGLELGEFDDRMVMWLAGWDTSTIATVVAWIERAKKATVKDLESRLNDAYYERDCLRDELDALREGGAK